MTSPAGSDHDVFLSYASVDRSTAGTIRDALLAAGLSVWMDDRRIDTFDGITAALKAGLAGSRSILVCLTRDYLDRPTCQWELCEALARTGEHERESRIFLVAVDGAELVDLPMALVDLRRLVLSPRSNPEILDALLAEAISRIRTKLARTEGTLGPELPPVVGRWWPRPPVASDTFTGRFLELIHLHGLLVGDAQLVLSRTVGTRRPVCLVGMGGVGKTLLAEEYSRRFGRTHPGGIFRISAYGDRIRRAGVVEEAWDELTGLLTGQMKNLLSHLYRAPTTVANDLPPLDSLSELSDLRAALHDVFAAADQPLLWIVDDVPDGLGVDELQTLLCPHPQLGANLLTSRSGAYQALMETIDLDTLDPDQSVALLARHRVPQTLEDRRHALTVAAALGGHPLALDVTGARLARGTLSYQDLSNRLRGEAVGGYEEIAAALRDELPTGHATSIVMTLSDSLDALPVASRRTIELASVLSPSDPVPFPLAAVLLPKGRSRGDGRPPEPSEYGDWNVSERAVQLVQDATDEVVGARLVRVDATSYVTHILVSGVARELLRRSSRLSRRSGQAVTRALAWKRTWPMVMHNPYSPQSAQLGLVSVRHLLHLTDCGIERWGRTSWSRRRELIELRMWFSGALDQMGFEVPARTAATDTITRVADRLGSDRQDLDYGGELLALAWGDDAHARMVVELRMLPMSDRWNGPLSTGSFHLLHRLVADLDSMTASGHLTRRPGEMARSELASRYRSAIDEAGSRRARLALMTEHRRLLKQLGRETEFSAVGSSMRELLDEWLADVRTSAEPSAEDGFEAFTALHAFRRSEGTSLRPDEWVAFLDVHERFIDELRHRAADPAATKDLVHTLEVRTAEADRRDELQRLEDKYRDILLPSPTPTWTAGSPLTSWDDVRREVEYLKSLPLDPDVTRIAERLHTMVDDILGEVGQDLSEYLSRVRFLLLILRREAEPGWDYDALSGAHPLTVESAAMKRRFEDEARYVRETDAATLGVSQGDYLALLAWIGDMLQGLAIGDDEDAPQTFLRLAQELEHTHGRLAPLTLEAWEGAAENSDRRGDLDEATHWQRGIAIRSDIANRYLQILDNATQSAGAASEEAFAALKKATEYLRLSERVPEILAVAQEFYEAVCRETGPRSAEARTARRLLAEMPSPATTAPEHATRFRDVLGSYAAVARKAGSGRRRVRAAGGDSVRRGGGDREQNRAIREWARQQGLDVNDRGRIPLNVVEAYHQSR